MKIENRIIETLNCLEFEKETFVCVSNSIIRKANFNSCNLSFELKIENCIISNFLIHSCWFTEGLILKNNHISNYVDYQMGGHNKKNIVIDRNIFNEFVNFFDCQFESPLEVTNNIFHKGTNLLGNVDEGYKNIFNTPIVIWNNIGDLAVCGVGETKGF